MQLKTCKKPEDNLNMRDETIIGKFAWHWPKGLWRRPVKQVQLPRVFIILRNLAFHSRLPTLWLSRNAHTKKSKPPSLWMTQCETNQKTESITNLVGYWWKSKRSLSLALVGWVLENYETEEVSLLLTELLIPSFLLPVQGPQGWNPRGSLAQLDNSWCKLKACCPRKDQNL